MSSFKNSGMHGGQNQGGWVNLESNGMAFEWLTALTAYTILEQPDTVNTISSTHVESLATLTTLTTLVLHMVAACVDIALKR